MASRVGTLSAIAFFVGLLFWLAAIGSGHFQDDAAEYEDEISGKIHVSGRVVSEDGDLLHNVQVHVRTSYYDPTLVGDRGEDEWVTIDGEFEFLIEDAVSLYLAFSKRGYFSETEQFAAYDLSDRRFGGFETHALEVVLRSRPVRANLFKVEGPLEADRHGPTKSLQVAERRGANQKGLDDAQGGESEIRLSARLSDGMKVDEIAYVTDDGAEIVVPDGVRLSSTGDGDGFSVYRPTRPYHLTRHAFREMAQAPEVGYEAEIDFSKHGGDRVFFYCRIDGRYGKGWVVRPAFGEGDKEVVIAWTLLFINPTGSRYVATDD